MLCAVFSGVDVVFVVVNERIICVAAWRYRTSQNYTKCNVYRVRQGLGYDSIKGPIKRALRRFRHELMRSGCSERTSNRHGCAAVYDFSKLYQV